MSAATSGWLLEAACRHRPIGWWYPEHNDPFATAVAVSICRRCAVRAECLADALEHDDPVYAAGIRGGLTAAQRAALRRRQLLDPVP